VADSAEPDIIRWAGDIRAQANALLRYSTNDYDRDRARRLIGIAAEMMAAGLHLPPAEVAATFDRRIEVITPLSVADAAVFDAEGRILLMQRADNGLWAMPGGACEVGETAAESAVRELYEEVGLVGEAVTLFGIWDSQRHPSRTSFHLYMHVFLCQVAGGTPGPSAEALAAGYFAPDALPPLSYGHTVRVPAACTLYQAWRRDGYVVPFFDR
jgi:ADP-ribose pyrophosphatase